MFSQSLSHPFFPFLLNAWIELRRARNWHKDTVEEKKIVLKFVLFVGKDCKKSINIFVQEARIKTVNILFVLSYQPVLLVKCTCSYMNEVIFSWC